MTQHVLKGKGNHRRGFWAAVVVVAAVCVAAFTPLATGAPPKHYALTVSPQTLCFTGAGQTQPFTVTLTNKSRNNAVGSANITAPSFITLTGLIGAPVGSSFDATTIKLRNLNLSTLDSWDEVTVTARIDTPGDGEWTSVAKQSNDFADSPGPGNLVALQGDPPPLTVDACRYVFTQGPVDAQKNVAQTVKVQLHAGTTPVAVSESLTLSAYQTIGTTTTSADSSFTGRLSTGTGQDATNTWSFSLTGTVSGPGYWLRAGSGTQATDSAPTFTIYDCVPTGTSGTCDIPFTPTGDGTSGASVSGTGIGSPIALSFETIPPTARAVCGASAPAGWGWSPLTFPEQPDGRTTFDGLVLSDFTYAAGGTGSLLVRTYLRNDLYVQTNPSNTNDIQICAGARHAHSANGDPAGAFRGRDGIDARWDTGTELYWGVLARIPNCNRARDLDGDGILDPALCGWGTTDIEGVTYRTATVLVPFDWDWKGIT